MSIKSQGAQAFNVPNDPEGREFLRLLKKYKNKGWGCHARGRGPRKAPGDNYVSFSRQMSIPQADSEWMAVYLDNSKKKQPYQPPAETVNPLTHDERFLVGQGLESLIEECDSVMTEEEWDTIGEIQSKLDLEMNNLPEPMEGEIQACGPLPPYVGMNHILLLKNGGYTFLPGDHVGINQFSLGHPIVGDDDGMIGVVMEKCGPEDAIKVRIG